MTTLWLSLFLASAAAGSTGGATAGSPSAAATAPQAPAPPAAPEVKGPPLPATPEFPSNRNNPTAEPAKGSGKKTAQGEEAGTVAGRRETPIPSSKSKKESSATQGRGVPALTVSALKNELRQSAAGASEPEQISERSRLEQLAAEIAKAREALREETAHLEELIRQRGSCDGELRAAIANPATAAQAADAKDAQREQMESVSKTMKGMKPEQAAAVVSRLDHRLASEILRRMRPADAGAVLGYLKPELAAELATEIATRKPLIPTKKGTATP